MGNVGYLAPSGTLGARIIRGCKPAPLSWRIRNTVRWPFLAGWLIVAGARIFTKITGIPCMVSELRAVKIDAQGRRTDFGVLSRRVVTNDGVEFITDAWRNSVELETMKYHGCGTGAGAEAAAETDLVTELTTETNPDNTRATGSLAGATNTFVTVGTVSFDGAAAVIEHGLFSDPTVGSGVLFDRSLFAAINVVSGDSIQFTYTLTLTAGG